jgi:hypothetical protein
MLPVNGEVDTLSFSIERFLVYFDFLKNPN